jgi:hypothetical protein
MLLAIIPWLALALIFFFAFSRNWNSTWHSIAVPSSGPSFMDLRGFPSGLEVARHGGDPLLANPLDPEKRRLNYPHLLAHLLWSFGISDKNIPIFGVIFCAFYLCCISNLIYSSKTFREALLLFIAGLSMAPLFGIEQGNTDLLIFSFVFLAFVLRDRLPGPLLFFAATLLKIYPAAAFAVDTIRRPPNRRTVSTSLLLLALTILAWRWRELDAIRHATPATYLNSYGILSLRKLTSFWALNNSSTLKNSTLLGWSVAVACWLAALLVVATTWKKAPSLDRVLLQSKTALLFSTFASIYVFSFLVGSNFDYRLIYLIPTLPFAIELARAPRHFRWAFVYIVLVLLVENWVSIEFGPGLIVAQFAALVVFLLALRVLAEQVRAFLWGHPPTGPAITNQY